MFNYSPATHQLPIYTRVGSRFDTGRVLPPQGKPYGDSDKESDYKRDDYSFHVVLHLLPLVTCAPRRNGLLTGSTRKRS